MCLLSLSHSALKRTKKGKPHQLPRSQQRLRFVMTPRVLRREKQNDKASLVRDILQSRKEVPL